MSRKENNLLKRVQEIAKELKKQDASLVHKEAVKKAWVVLKKEKK